VYKRASRLFTEEEENCGRRMVGLSCIRWDTVLSKVTRRGHWDMSRHMWTGKDEPDVDTVKSVLELVVFSLA